MKQIAIALVALAGLAGAANAQTPATVRLCAGTQPNCPLVSATNPLPTTGTFTPSGTQNVNLMQILSAVPSATNPLWVSPATGATFPVSQAAGSVASGAYLSGSYASGSLASGAVVDLFALSAPITPATATGTKSILLGMQYNSTQATFTNAQQGAVQGTSRGAIYVATGSDAFTATVNGSGTAGTANAGVLTIQGIASMTPVQVTLPTTPLIASGNGVIAAPTSVSTGATTRSSGTAAASSQVLKASAGNLYDLKVTIGATSGYLLLFDATSLPSNGAVTPVFCERVNSDGTAGGASFAWPMPFPFATGITAGFSTTGCFTLTASATAAFFGGYK